MRRWVFELSIAALVLVLAKVFAREIMQISWPAYLGCAAAGAIGTLAGARLMNKRRTA